MSPEPSHLLERDLQYYEDRAHGLLSVLADGVPAALAQVRSWHPRFRTGDDETLRTAPAEERFTLEDARLVYAREHGLESWEALAAHLGLVASGSVTEPLILALEAGKSGDWPAVVRILQSYPDLIRARGTNGNSVLSLACSMVRCTDPEDPPDAERLAPVRYLLAAGAEVNQPNYRGWTPLHDAGYRNDPELAALLLEAGARPDAEAHGSGGTPLCVALFWGHGPVAELLARAGILPCNLRIASGLGRLDLVSECFDSQGRLTAAARSSRAFYRPHSGFPFRAPTDDPQHVLDEALTWAARSNRVDAMETLVARGARIEADPYRGTPLLWAAARGRTEAVTWLIDHGAGINQPATFGGPAHGENITALHLAAQNGDRRMIDLLISLGADRRAEDGLYHGTPAGWAEHHGHSIPELHP